MTPAKKNPTLKELREEAKERILQVVIDNKGKSVETIRKRIDEAKPPKFNGAMTRGARAWDEERSLALSELLRWPDKKKKSSKVIAIFALMILSGQPCLAISNAPEEPKLRPYIRHQHQLKGKRCYRFWCREHHPKIRKAAVDTKPFVDYAGSVGQVVFTIFQFWK